MNRKAPVSGTLSICMIVKNEAALLGRCLESVCGAADQIVVADTGSTDSTVEIAKKFGACVVEAPWRNDFAWARNESLKHASGAWILWLDADDIVPVSSIPLLNDLKKKKTDRVYAFIVKNERPGDTGSEFIQARMFPNRPEIRFERRIHEQMMPSAIRAGLKMEQFPLVIEHHGYADPATLRKKAGRNIELMLQDYDHSHPDPVTAVEIADSYFLVDDLEKSQEWYEHLLSIKKIVSDSPALAGQAYMGLGNIFNKRERYNEAVEALEKASGLSPWRPDILYSMAVARELGGDRRGAIAALNSILALQPQPGMVGVDFRSSAVKAIIRLVRLLLETGECTQAEILIRNVEKEYGNRPEVRNAGGKVFLRNNHLMDALHEFEESLKLRVEGNVDAYIGLCLIYRKAGYTQRVVETVCAVEKIFENNKRFGAFRYLIDNQGNPLHSDPAVQTEIEFLRKEYPGLI